MTLISILIELKYDVETMMIYPPRLDPLEHILGGIVIVLSLLVRVVEPGLTSSSSSWP